MGELVSFVAGSALFVMSAMVMKVSWPRSGSLTDPAFFLGLAIFLGFLGHALNTLWWQVSVNLLIAFGLAEYAGLRSIGLWLDGILKSIATLSGAMHLIALQRKLRPDEQAEYHWYDMPWYPRRFRVFVRKEERE